MISLLPPTGKPIASDAGDNRVRKDDGSDFAGWLRADRRDADAARAPDDRAANHPQEPAIPALPGAGRDPLEPMITKEVCLQPEPGLELELELELTAPRVALDADDGAGVSAQIELPWRLQANAGLSYRGGRADALPLPATTLEAGHAGAVFDGLMVAGDAGKLASDAASRASRGNAIQARLAAATALVEALSLEGLDASERLGKLGLAASKSNWPERLLRWLANDDRVTAWVRDYQLDAGSREALVDSLRALAEQEGRPLHRIMLNGHELWRAANPSTRTNITTGSNS